MKSFLIRCALLIGIFLLIFVIAEAAGFSAWIENFLSQRKDSQEGLWLIALISTLLLISDIFMPLPSSFLLAFNGYIFGALLGTLVNLAGCILSAAVGWAIGCYGGPLLEKILPEEDHAQAEGFFKRWGSFAIVISRPLPLLAETIAVYAGLQKTPFIRMMIYSFIGSLPAAFLYAKTASLAASNEESMMISIQVFVAVCLLAALAWFIGRRLRPAEKSPDEA